jgi:hypothetical protein
MAKIIRRLVNQRLRYEEKSLISDQLHRLQHEPCQILWTRRRHRRLGEPLGKCRLAKIHIKTQSTRTTSILKSYPHSLAICWSTDKIFIT